MGTARSSNQVGDRLDTYCTGGTGVLDAFPAQAVVDRMQKVPQPSKPTWVSVQDVVLNSLRPSTQPSQPLPELSHFYHTHKQQGEMSCSCRYGSCWCVTP